MRQASLLRPHNPLNLRPLRPRQENAIEAIRQAIREGHRRIVIQGPTGMGKTLTAAHIMAGSIRKGKRPIFICPAINLVNQTVKAFEGEGIMDIGVIQAQHERTDWEAQVQVASVQTLIRRPLPEDDIIIIDEVHQNFEGLNKILDSDAWKDKIVVGLSATPWAKGMGLRWTKLIIAGTTKDGMAEGWLSKYVGFGPPHDPDLSGVKVKRGEFDEGQLSTAMRDVTLVGDAVEHWKERWGKPNTFLFAVDRAHAKELQEKFAEQGIKFGYMDGESDPDERKKTFAAYRSGEIMGICNVGVLVTGVDEDVRCLIDCAPTKSEIRYVQKFGRGIRPAEGKEFLIYLDHAGNAERLGFPEDIHHNTLDMRKPGEKGEAFKEDKKPAKPKKCPTCHSLIKGGVRVCPKCLAKLPYTGVTHDSGELVEFGTVAKKKADKFAGVNRQEWYSGFLTLAAERGRSEGWAAHRYKEKFGTWPNGLNKTPGIATVLVRNFDRSRRIAYAKSKEKPQHEVAKAG